MPIIASRRIIRTMDFADAVELGDVDAVGQAALAAAGEVTAAELLEAALLRLDAGRDLNAVITDLFARGQQQAADLDASGVLRTGAAGPLAGVSFLLKDLGASLAGGCCSAGIPVNAREFYQPHLHQFTERTVWHFIEEWLGKVSKSCASIPLLEIGFLCQEVEQEVR